MSSEEKLRILAELDEPGAKFIDVARRNEVSRSLLWPWRDARRDASTISRELRRNAATRSGGLEYRAATARGHAERAARRPKLAVNAALRKYSPAASQRTAPGPTKSPRHA
jgi:transposase-like protein